MEKPVAAASLRERLDGAGLELVCPSCKGPLADREDAFECGACRRAYPVVAGIPDFRLLPDRFISLEDDRRKGLRALDLAQARGGGFEAALDAYWSITPELAPQLAARHRAHQLLEVDIGEQTLREMERLVVAAARRTNADSGQSSKRGEELVRPNTLLDIGCGTAGLLAATGSRFRLAAGVDVAFRWLLVGRLRLNEAGLDCPLICANAEYLPFSGGVFDRVIANDLLEHVVAPGRVLAECRRVIAPAGRCYLATNNRYSLAPEPHVHLWGVGWLARGLQPSYVQSMRNHSYRNVSLLSASELSRLAAQAGLRCASIEAAPLYASHLGGTVERIVGVYNSLRLLPPLRTILRLLGPRVQSLCSPNRQSFRNQ
ncbi:MAG: methyltransferase domain-containing protein [Bryobacterales bacterium]